MRTVKCSIHNVEFTLPTTEEEFHSGQMHEEVMRIQLHSEEYPKCKMRGENQK
jgi:hypothetical protein